MCLLFSQVGSFFLILYFADMLFKPPTGLPCLGPAEFHPGEPWKGLPQIDPESDPDITPGSVSFLRDRNPGVSPSSSPISTTLPSSSAWPPSASSNGYHNGYTPTYSTTGKLAEQKSSWASDTQLQGHLGNDMWQVPLPPGKSSHGPSRPPPGLASLKTPLPWVGGSRWADQEHGHMPAAMNWSKDCASSGRASTWLVLRNLTPQIDGSTLRTLCMQHGPLITFHLSLAHGNALVCYSSREEAGKAQKSLHM
uniref:TNRC6 PABC binding domain-containing protein n=1 Tax=Eptatretus burgeri TaxID=7764 RepID=A0A8C4N9P0_EPTBU